MTIEAKSKTVNTGTLLFDSKNTRLPEDRRHENQRRLLHELLENEDIRGLATSIAKKGLYPHERLVVMPTGTRYTVLEGNRRLAAVKLLLSPELAPTPHQVRYFRRLSAKIDLNSISKLDVTIVPDRISAAPIIAALHTGSAKKRWSSVQQARFYRELIDEGQTAAEIAEELGVGLAQVKSFLRTEQLYRIAVTLDYDQDTKKKVLDPNFPLTTLERFVESTEARKFLGIELDDDSGFRGVVHPERFKAALSKVAADVATKRGLTRQVNTEEDFKAYVDRAKRSLPSTRVRGKFSPGELLGEDSSGAEFTRKGNDAKPKPVKKPKQSKSVVPAGFSCNPKSERVKAIFDELKLLRLDTHKNSAGVMLRVLLDIALWEYLKREGLAVDAQNHIDKDGKKRRRNKNWTPALRDLISYSADKNVFKAMTADGYKATRSLAAKDANYFVTIDGFNEFTHNPYVTPTEADLRALWQRAEPMLEEILN